MGVTGLWTVLSPTARPTQLATLNRKRLAVDASIWIYQFLKAVRDKEGNALRNSHVVGFFRRICKLLYFGVKPVFIFDGGAPGLKRDTVRARAKRREGRREDAVRTAGRLLGVQMRRRLEEETAAAAEGKRLTNGEAEDGRGHEGQRTGRRAGRDEEDEDLPPEEAMVYADELGMSSAERQLHRGKLPGNQNQVHSQQAQQQQQQQQQPAPFRKKDQYHLPHLDSSIESMGAPNDPRIMSQAELEEYARQFHSGEDINLYDFSKIDFESPFFLSLPPSDRYNILNAARLRSRLRMGYSKEQLDGMFPDRMAFSRFQIERVRERNELTQRLMHVNGMADDFVHQGGRIAGEKGKEYVLVKNEGVEGGWALGVVSNQGRHEADAIDLDHDDERANDDYDDENGGGSKDGLDGSGDDDDFEDVAIEGLNRLPRKWARHQKELDYNPDYKNAAEQIAEKRRAVYEARQKAAATEALRQQQPEPQRRRQQDHGDALFVEKDPHHPGQVDAADELFEDVDVGLPPAGGGTDIDDEQSDLQRAIQMSLRSHDHSEGPFFSRENDVALDSKRDFEAEAETGAGFDLQAALAESRRSKYQTIGQKDLSTRRMPEPSSGQQEQAKKFSGPLPFESLNLGQSILGKRKAAQIEQDQAGGFEREDASADQQRAKANAAAPLPRWFEARNWTADEKEEVINQGDFAEATSEQSEMKVDEKGKVMNFDNPVRQNSPDWPALDSEQEDEDEKEEGKKNVIDVDAPSLRRSSAEAIEVDSSDEDGKSQRGAGKASSHTFPDAGLPDVSIQDQVEDGNELIKGADAVGLTTTNTQDTVSAVVSTSSPAAKARTASDHEVDRATTLPREERRAQYDGLGKGKKATATAAVPGRENEDEELDEVFEDVEVEADILDSSGKEEYGQHARNGIQDTLEAGSGFPVESDDPFYDAPADEDYISESEEELMRQMATEAEEHARFTSALQPNGLDPATRSAASKAADYEKELKQLRHQQKRDRRDADEVTQVMVQECQALLRLFGLPYVTAPMEAEAQCAALVDLGLVDGIVTDDSDIFLFGGTRVYKNMFNAAKFVECYLAADLEKEYALDRVKMIRLAHLLGSDYTEGVAGIGPVTALEIISEFDNLEAFRDWCISVQMDVGARPGEKHDPNTTTSQTKDPSSAFPSLSARVATNLYSTPFRRKFKKQAQKLILPASFPDPRVDQAYLHPDIDSDSSSFEWGVPDLDRLRSFLMATIGWTPERTDEVLVPVVRDMHKRATEGTQSNVTRFFQGGIGIGARDGARGGGSGDYGAPKKRSEGKVSGRMQRAFGRLKNGRE